MDYEYLAYIVTIVTPILGLAGYLGITKLHSISDEREFNRRLGHIREEGMLDDLIEDQERFEKRYPKILPEKLWKKESNRLRDLKSVLETVNHIHTDEQRNEFNMIYSASKN